jgi:PKD repeat protein
VSTSIFAGAFQVGISASNDNPAPNNNVTFTASIAPNTVNIEEYFWEFGDGMTRTTSGPVTTYSYAPASSGQTLTAKVTAIPVTGRSRQGVMTIRVQ